MAAESIVTPLDQYNTQLLDNVRPQHWRNPTPDGRYNLVVIGAGSAGLVTAAGAAGLGARVALVERNLLGGDCLNVGCVPSKCLIRSGRAAADTKRAGALGVRVDPEARRIDFAATMERLRAVRAGISSHDSAERFSGLGVDVFLGDGAFTSRSTLEVGGATLEFKKAVIATGTRPLIPKVEGLQEAGYLTNETIFNLTEQPRSLAVIGAGPIGCELAQAMARLGTRVTVFQRSGSILSREDSEASAVVGEVFGREGIKLVTGCQVEKVATTGSGKVVHYGCGGKHGSVEVEEILVASGRVPNVEGMGLDVAGVEYDTFRGVHVDDTLRTTNGNIYAAGDICLEHKFTHAADASARLVIRNALFLGRGKVSGLVIPRCTYTDPEVASVGLSRADAENRGIELDSFTRQLADVDRAKADGDTDGYVTVHVRKGTDKIVGGTVVASHAGEMIGELTLAMSRKIGLGSLAGVIHPYPTQAEAIKQTSDAYYRTRFTPLVARLFKRWLAWTR
jgi:pyruvate/2-oxoglutarate dehydrogenase complex dihydrolipoamide dehydrogenase (E3) component